MINEYLIEMSNGVIKSTRNYADSLIEAMAFAEKMNYNWTGIYNKVTGEFQQN